MLILSYCCYLHSTPNLLATTNSLFAPLGQLLFAIDDKQTEIGRAHQIMQTAAVFKTERCQRKPLPQSEWNIPWTLLIGR